MEQVINVKQEHLLPGEVPAWTPSGIKRQWLTRLEYFAHSPYEVIVCWRDDGGGSARDRFA